jgi:C4-dicarboxylate-specific signal transduction histidine kinase
LLKKGDLSQWEAKPMCMSCTFYVVCLLTSQGYKKLPDEVRKRVEKKREEEKKVEERRRKEEKKQQKEAAKTK